MNFDEIKFKFEHELTNSTVKPRSRRYSQELKMAVITAMKSQEKSIYETSKALGLSATTIYNWISKEPSPNSQPIEELFIPEKLVTTQQERLPGQVLSDKRCVTIYLHSGEKIEFSY